MDTNLDFEEFVRIAIALQDEGLLMYEALLVGVGSEPQLRDVVLTMKGRSKSPAF